MESINKVKQIVEAALLAAGEPITAESILKLFDEDERPELNDLRTLIRDMQNDYEGRGFELKELASGFTIQVRQELSPYIKKMWEEKPPRYSRAMLETLVLIAYRQPITRAEIEEVRGVAVSSHIVKVLMERQWVRIVGHRDVPGRPALLATTKKFLDYFNLKNLSDLPSLAEIQDLDNLNIEIPGQIELEVNEETVLDAENDDASLSTEVKEELFNEETDVDIEEMA